MNILRRRFDPVAEQIVRDLAGMVVTFEDRDDRTAQIGARYLRMALFNAASTCYAERTDDMSASAAVDWIDKRIDGFMDEWRRVATL